MAKLNVKAKNKMIFSYSLLFSKGFSDIFFQQKSPKLMLRIRCIFFKEPTSSFIAFLCLHCHSLCLALLIMLYCKFFTCLFLLLVVYELTYFYLFVCLIFMDLPQNSHSNHGFSINEVIQIDSFQRISQSDQKIYNLGWNEKGEVDI